MKLKLMLFSSLILLLSITATAQTYKENIIKDFKHLNDLMNSGKYEEAADLFPERIFEIASREELIAAFDQMLNSKDFKVKVLDYKVLEVSAPEKIEDTHYAELKYSSKMTMAFTPPEDETLEARKMRLEKIRTYLANQFGSSNVILDELTQIFTLNPVKRSYGISKDGQRDWKFVNIEQNQRVIMEKLLPKQILDRELN